MNRDAFLQTLDRLLSSLPYSERRDIMYDYEAHFEGAMEDGKTEADVLAGLEPPEVIASKYLGISPKVLREEYHLSGLAETTIKEEEPIPKLPLDNQSNYSPQVPLQKRNSVGMIIVLSVLLLILTSIVFSTYIGFWLVPIVLFVLSLVGIFGGFTLLISTLVALPLSVFSIEIIAASHPIFLFALSVACIALGGLLLIGTFYIGKALSYLAYYYTRWCFKSIRGY